MSCDFSSLSNIKRQCGPLPLSLAPVIYYTPMSQFQSLPTIATDGVTVTALNLITGGKFLTIESSNKKGAYKGQGKEGGNFTPMVEAHHPKVNATSSSAFQAMLNQLYAVIYSDNNGNLMMLLNAEIEYDPTIDDQSNGYLFKFMCGNQGNPILFLVKGLVVPF